MNYFIIEIKERTQQTYEKRAISSLRTTEWEPAGPIPEVKPNDNDITIGKILYQWLFQGTVRDAWIEAIGFVEGNYASLSLCLDIGNDQKLWELPWELLYDNNTNKTILGYLGLRCPIVRIIHSQQPSIETLPTLENILLLTSIAISDVPQGFNKSEEILASTKTQKVLYIEEFLNLLRDVSTPKFYDLIYILAHGITDKIYLQSNSGRFSSLTEEELITHIRGKAKLVYLSVCKSARLAHRLVEETDLIGVLGTSIEIPNETAQKMFYVFFETLHIHNNLYVASLQARINASKEPDLPWTKYIFVVRRGIEKAMESPSLPRPPFLPSQTQVKVIRIEIHPNKSGKGKNLKIIPFVGGPEDNHLKILSCKFGREIEEKWNREDNLKKLRKEFNEDPDINKFRIALVKLIEYIRSKYCCRYDDILIEIVLPPAFVGIPFEQIWNPEQQLPLGAIHEVYIVPNNDRAVPVRIMGVAKKEIRDLNNQETSGQWAKNYKDFLVFLTHQCYVNDLCNCIINVLCNQSIPFISHRLPVNANKQQFLKNCTECPIKEQYQQVAQKTPPSNNIWCPEIQRFFDGCFQFVGQEYEKAMNEILRNLMALRSDNIDCPEIQDLFIVCKNGDERKIKAIPRDKNIKEVQQYGQ